MSAGSRELSYATFLTVVGWALLALGCLMAAQSVYALVTGRFPPPSHKVERASQVRPKAWSLMFLALAVVALGLPRVLDSPSEWQIAFHVLVLVFLVGVGVMRAKAEKAANSTESRDVHRTL